MKNEIHVNDIGTVFAVTLKDLNTIVDVSTAILMTIIFKKPNGTVQVNNAVFTTNGVDGGIEYVSVANDLDIAGTWELQAHIQLPQGEWKSDIGTFDVYANL